jgi:polyvinyl alcohol dehydrogenase (cytochrome)
MTPLKLATLAAFALVSSSAFAQLPAQAPTAADDPVHPQGTNLGIYTFSARCSNCHDTHKDNAPDRHSLSGSTAEDIFASITTGGMKQYAADLTDLQRRVLSVYVAGRPFGSSPAGDASNMPNHCAAASKASLAQQPGEWNGWGIDLDNSRFQQTTSINAENVSRLKLKWAFGFPNGNSAYAQPAIFGGRVFIGADTGYVYSLAAASGCIYWSFRANAGVRTAVVIGPGRGTTAKQIALFGDIKGNVYALNAETGAKLWVIRADTHPLARITGAPVLFDGVLFVPISSLEESGSGNANYPCCTFRGSIAAIKVNTGKLLWKSYTIAEEPGPTKKTSVGTQMYAPAGAALWSSPTLDLKRHAIYVATGNGYTEPAAHETDAIIAFDLKTGKQLWVQEVLANDNYIRDCPGKYRPNVPKNGSSETCPASLGPDLDFGSAPILRDLPDGRTLVIAAQKSGDAWALDPDKKGEVVWHKQLTANFENGGGGMQWGSAADKDTVYFPITRGGPKYGMAALKLSDGDVLWRGTPPVSAQAPATVVPGVVFSGATMGILYAYSAKDGTALWNYDTNHTLTTVNGVEAKGGGIGGASGPVVTGNMLYTTSGYADLFGGTLRGNVLLAFSLDY